MRSLVIMASGRGSNARAIIEYFHETDIARVRLIVTNKADAGVVQVAEEYHVPFLVVDKHTVKEALFQDQLEDVRPSLIVLAGWLWLVPPNMVSTYADRIVNIHPALLPTHGGKGLYGSHVHKSVLQAKDSESGITVHYVDERYDEGRIILQARCRVLDSDTPETLGKRVLSLEHFYYPRAIHQLLLVPTDNIGR